MFPGFNQQSYRDWGCQVIIQGTRFTRLSPVYNKFWGNIIFLSNFRNSLKERNWLVWFMVFNATFNNISVISWRSVLLVEETEVHWESNWPVAIHWQTERNRSVGKVLRCLITFLFDRPNLPIIDLLQSFVSSMSSCVIIKTFSNSQHKSDCRIPRTPWILHQKIPPVYLEDPGRSQHSNRKQCFSVLSLIDMIS